MSMLLIFGRPDSPDVLTVADEDADRAIADIEAVYGHDLSDTPVLSPIRVIDWDHSDEEPRCPLRRRQRLTRPDDFWPARGIRSSEA